MSVRAQDLLMRSQNGKLEINGTEDPFFNSFIGGNTGITSDNPSKTQSQRKLSF